MLIVPQALCSTVLVPHKNKRYFQAKQPQIMDKDKENLLALLFSSDPDTVAVGLMLEESQNIDLTEFWAHLIKLFGLKTKQLQTQEKIKWLRYAATWRWVFSQRYKAVPASLCIALNIKHLDISNNYRHVTDLPLALEALTKMEYLDMHGNEITEIPLCVRAYKQLRELRVHCNKLQKLPEWLPELTLLQRINFARNVDMDWAQAMSVLVQMPNLKYIKFNYNLVVSFPIEQIEKITSIHLSYLDSPNNISSLFGAFAYFKHLRKLRLMHLHLDCYPTVPPIIGELVHLEELQLTHCRIDALPDSLAQLKKLRKLSLRGNSIVQLPDNFGELEQLEMLSLRENPIIEFPPSVVNLKKLRRVDLRGCSNNPPIPAEWANNPKILILR